MTINGYTLPEIQKTVIALVVAVISLAGYFIAFDPGTQSAAIAVVIAVFNVISVFLAKNHTFDDVQKAVQALQASSLGLIALFITVDPSTIQSIGAVILAVLNVYGVWSAKNATLPPPGESGVRAVR